MTVVGTVTAQTEMLLLDDITTVIRTGKVQSHIECPHRGTLGKDHIPPSAMAKTTETETTTGTTAGTGTDTTAGIGTDTIAGTGTGTTAETGTDTTAEIGTDTTGIIVTVNTGRWMTTAQETIVWT